VARRTPRGMCSAAGIGAELFRWRSADARCLQTRRAQFSTRDSRSRWMSNRGSEQSRPASRPEPALPNGVPGSWTSCRQPADVSGSDRTTGPQDDGPATQQHGRSPVHRSRRSRAFVGAHERLAGCRPPPDARSGPTACRAFAAKFTLKHRLNIVHNDHVGSTGRRQYSLRRRNAGLAAITVFLTESVIGPEALQP